MLNGKILKGEEKLEKGDNWLTYFARLKSGGKGKSRGKKKGKSQKEKKVEYRPNRQGSLTEWSTQEIKDEEERMKREEEIKRKEERRKEILKEIEDEEEAERMEEIAESKYWMSEDIGWRKFIANKMKNDSNCDEKWADEQSRFFTDLSWESLKLVGDQEDYFLWKKEEQRKDEWERLKIEVMQRTQKCIGNWSKLVKSNISREHARIRGELVKKFKYNSFEYWLNYDFDKSSGIGDDERDLMKMRVAWAFWHGGSLNDEERKRKLYKVHEGALKIMKKIENDLTEKFIQFKEADDDPRLGDDFKLLMGIMELMNLHEMNKKMNRCTLVVNHVKYVEDEDDPCVRDDLKLHIELEKRNKLKDSWRRIIVATKKRIMDKF